MDTKGVYDERGFGGRQGPGSHPCLLIVDFSKGFTDPASPFCCDSEAPVEATAKLLERARALGRPVIYTTVAYDRAGLAAAEVFLAKAPMLASLTPGGKWSEIDERIAPKDDEPLIEKIWASAFFATPLPSMLTACRCDTLIVVGASTSGCVRATVVDGLQHGYRVIVPRDAVADRAPSAHEASLLDIDAKYGDVVSLDEALSALDGA